MQQLAILPQRQQRIAEDRGDEARDDRKRLDFENVDQGWNLGPATTSIRAWPQRRLRPHPHPEDQPDLEQSLDGIARRVESSRAARARIGSPGDARIDGTAVSTSTILNAAE